MTGLAPAEVVEFEVFMLASGMDDRIPCNLAIEGDEEECHRAAVWSFACPGCGDLWIPCNYHREVADASVTRMVKRGYEPVCTTCDYRLPAPFPWALL